MNTYTNTNTAIPNFDTTAFTDTDTAEYDTTAFSTEIPTSLDIKQFDLKTTGKAATTTYENIETNLDLGNLGIDLTKLESTPSYDTGATFTEYQTSNLETKVTKNVLPLPKPTSIVKQPPIPLVKKAPTPIVKQPPVPIVKKAPVSIVKPSPAPVVTTTQTLINTTPISYETSPVVDTGLTLGNVDTIPDFDINEILGNYQTTENTTNIKSLAPPIEEFIKTPQPATITQQKKINFPNKWLIYPSWNYSFKYYKN